MSYITIMKNNFKKVLNKLGVDKYQVSDVLDVKINYALDLIMYENKCRELNVEHMKLIKKAFHISADDFIDDNRQTMDWKDIKKLLNSRSERVYRTLCRWNWLSLKEDKFKTYPLLFVEQLCDELGVNFRHLVFH